MAYGFDKGEQCVIVKKEEIYREVFSYSLQGTGGTHNGSSLVIFKNGEFTMCELILVPSKEKGNTGYGLSYNPITDLTLTFDVSVNQ
jgi:hypothetical protein